MPPRRQQRVQEVYERDMEQRIQEMIDDRMDRVVAQLTDRLTTILGNQNQNHHRPPVDVDIDEEDEYEEELPRRRPRNAVEGEDRRRWETGMRTEIPEFHGSLQPEDFLDWLATVEEILDFKGVPENKRVPLIATRLRGRATAWWQQIKLTRTRLGKSKIVTWEKMKKHLRAEFLPYNF